MDRQIDQWTTWIIQWSLIQWNWITEVWDASLEYSAKLLQSLEHAHKRDIWIFINENELPYCVKEGFDFPVPSDSLFYYPDTNSFTLNNRLQAARSQRFDVVAVSLVEPGGTEHDLTSFFHSITWKDHGAPSLWEVVELYFLHQKQPISHNFKESCRLEILDSDAEEHRIPLNSSICRRRFSGWT